MIKDSVSFSKNKEYKSKYCHQKSYNREKIHQNFENMNIFMVVSGAIVCKLLKYFDKMDIEKNLNTKIVVIVTNHARIEK